MKSLVYNTASFFLQVATVANVSKDAFTKVKYAQGWKVNGECNDKAKIAKCGTYFHAYGRAEKDKTSSNDTFWVHVKSNAHVFKVAYDTDAMGNATELTLAKAKSGVKPVNVATPWKTDKTTPEVTVETTMPATNALGKHPSTISYGFTVTALIPNEVLLYMVTYMAFSKTTATKPVVLMAVRNSPEFIVLTDKSSETTKIVGVSLITVSLIGAGGEASADAVDYALDQDNNGNSMSAATVDATNKNEHFLSTNVYVNTAKKIRVSQAYILQTADLKYKVLPKAYFTGSTADVKFAKTVKKNTMIWATFTKAEDVITGGTNSISSIIALSYAAKCKFWTTTFLRDDGEAAYDCYYNAVCTLAGCTSVTVYQKGGVYHKYAFPAEAQMNDSKETLKIAHVVKADAKLKAIAVVQVVKVGTSWAAKTAAVATSNFATVFEVTSGTWKEADLGPTKPKEKKVDSGEGEEAAPKEQEAEKFSTLVVTTLLSMMI